MLVDTDNIMTDLRPINFEKSKKEFLDNVTEKLGDYSLIAKDTMNRLDDMNLSSRDIRIVRNIGDKFFETERMDSEMNPMRRARRLEQLNNIVEDLNINLKEGVQLYKMLDEVRKYSQVLQNVINTRNTIQDDSDISQAIRILKGIGITGDF